MDAIRGTGSVRPHIADSRLLTNLVRTEKDYIAHLSASVTSSQAAASALAAWGTSEVADVAGTSEELSRLLHEVAEAQRTHVQAIEGYRAALKDVLDREAAIREVVRDRDILVGRLIKASKKKPKEGREEARAEKVHEAQRELQACEQVLASEEAALIGVKRRTFKEALTMRMKIMGDVGNAMVEAAQEAILLLDEFDSNAMGPQGGMIVPTSGGEIGYADEEHVAYQNGLADGSQYYAGDAYGQEQAYDQQYEAQPQQPYADPVPENASVTPSQSASQAAGPPQRGFYAPAQGPVPPAHRLNADVGAGGEPFMPAEGDDAGSRSRTPMPPPPEHPYAAQERYEQEQQQQQYQQQQVPMGDLPRAYQPGQYLHNGNSAAPTPPEKDAAAAAFPPQQQQRYQQQQPEEEESSSEEDERPTVAHAGGGSRNAVPQQPQQQQQYGHARNESTDMSGSALSREAPFPGRGSPAGGNSDRDPRKKSSGFFGRMSKLFKTDVKEATQSASGQRRDDDDERNRSQGTWRTRTDSNLRTGSRRQSLLQGNAFQAPRDREEEGGSSDEGPDPSTLVRHVNQPRPLWQDGGDTSTGLLSLKGKKSKKASSDIGPSPLSRPTGLLRRTDSSASRTSSIIAGPRSWKQKQEDDELLKRARESVMSAGMQSTTSYSVVDTSVKKKKKKRAPSVSGSEIGTSATRVAPAAPSASAGALLAQRALGGSSDSVSRRHSTIVVPGDASTGLRRSDSLNTTGRGSVKSSKSKKRQSLASTSFADDAKHATGNWVARAEGGSSEPKQNLTAAEVAAGAGVVAKGQGIPTSQAVSAATQHVQENAYSTSNSVSRSTGSSLKPSLKGSLSRSNSKKSSRQPIPDMGPVISAPPPASTLLNSDNLYNGPVAGRVPMPPVAKAPLPAVPVEEQEAPSAPQPPASRLSHVSEEKSPATDEDDDKESFSSARPGLPQRESFRSATERPTLASAGSFDGTGALNVQYDGDRSRSSPAPASKLETPKRETREGSLPRLEMPLSEPFTVSLDARRGSPAPNHELEGGLVTPGEEKALRKLLAAGDEEDAAAKSKAEKEQQERNNSGVTRTTAVKAKLSAPSSEVGVESKATSTDGNKLTPSRVYGKGAPVDSSSDEEESPAPRHLDFGSAQSGSASTAATTMSPPAPLHSAMRSHSPIPPSAMKANKPASIMSDASGSALSRRKSVRLAPDTKLPPETPTSPVPPPISMYQVSAPGSSIGGSAQISSRIAPPPAAPSRVTRDDRANDFGADGESSRSTWTTRIGTAQDDSSDDGEYGGGDYASARRAFGSASRHLGKATGTIKSKAKKAVDGESVSSKKKKKSSSRYNPDIPLPDMVVVARGGSSAR